jgi:hypothetical protein
MKKTRLTKSLDIRHVLAALVGVVCFALVFTYSGDSDFLFAISSGLAASAISFLTANFALALRNSVI